MVPCYRPSPYQRNLPATLARRKQRSSHRHGANTSSSIPGDLTAWVTTSIERLYVTDLKLIVPPGQYKDFSYVTIQSLKNALAESALSLSEEDLQAMLKAYDSLSIFPDVARTCEKLRTTPDIHPVVFSNGTQEMVSNSVMKSQDFKEHGDVFEAIVTVEEVKKYKPAMEVYHHLAEKVGMDPKNSKDLERIWLVSGNPFDIVGARAAGLSSIWVNRKGGKRGWEDGLVEGEKGRPTEVVQQLHEAVVTVMSHAVDLAGQWSEFHGASEEHGSRETAREGLVV
jgi:2-haloacid dehalogenase